MQLLKQDLKIQNNNPKQCCFGLTRQKISRRKAKQSNTLRISVAITKPRFDLAISEVLSFKPTMSNKRKCLTVQEKLGIIDSLNGKVKTRNQICEEYGIGLSSISKIFKDEAKLRNEAFQNKNLSSKRFRPSNYESVNNALTLWFNQARASSIPISGPLIMEKAKKLAQELNVDFEPNNGWLQRWKTSNNITFQKMQGERASADTEGANNWVDNVLPNLCRNYAACDIYNTDESALFYKALPSGTMAVAGSKPTSTKVPKDRITALFLTNQDGSDKKIFVIGKARRPRCFTGVKQLPLPYYNNTKAWMTSSIWTQILAQWHRSLTRKVVLLCDNAACHKYSGTSLRNIEIIFLPANTTSLVQPVDQGFIHCTKVYYRKNICRRQLAAMHVLKQSWWLVRPETIQNCFRKAGFAVKEHSPDIVVNEPA